MGLGCEAGFAFYVFLPVYKRWEGCESDEGKRESGTQSLPQPGGVCLISVAECVFGGDRAV